MTWQIAITGAAIGLLALLHLAFAPPAAPPVAAGQPAAAAGASWGRWLALAAIAAAAIALAALIVPAVFGGSNSSTSSTHSTTTTMPSTTTQPTTTHGTTSTTQPTTTHHTTTTTTHHTTTATRPTTTTTGVTTTPGPPPKGSATLVRGIVTGTGQLAVVQNRLGGAVTVSPVSPGVYRIELSDLSAEARRKSVVRVSAGPRTTAVGGWSADGQLVVLVSDKQTGAPAKRPFSFVVLGPKQSAALPRTT
jgi:hypothetical protein